MLCGRHGRALTADLPECKPAKRSRSRSPSCHALLLVEAVWEWRDNTFHLYSLQMAHISGIMQIWRFLCIYLIFFFFLNQELKPSACWNRHGASSLQWDIIYSAAVSITNASHSAIAHWEQCRNGLQFELDGNSPPSSQLNSKLADLWPQWPA